MINLSMVDVPRKQSSSSLDIKHYNNRVIVAGTRNYTNKLEFHKEIVRYVNSTIEDILFISGAAYSGADRMIIDWCKRYQYPCLEIPAIWETNGEIDRSAGYKRNIKMLEMATALICFYDGSSNGAGHMIKIAKESNIPVSVIEITI